MNLLLTTNISLVGYLLRILHNDYIAPICRNRLSLSRKGSGLALQFCLIV